MFQSHAGTGSSSPNESLSARNDGYKALRGEAGGEKSDKEAPLMVSAATASKQAKLVLSLVKQLSTELMRLVRVLAMLPSMTELQVFHSELSHSL